MPEHYADAFSLPPGCYRYVSGPNGQPRRCPARVEFRGQIRNPKGRLFEVESCAWHSEELGGTWEWVRPGGPLGIVDEGTGELAE